MTPTATHERVDLLGQLEDEVGVMIRRIRRVIRERAQSVHPELQSSTYLMLSWLEQHGPVRASAMAEAFCIDKGAISRQVQHLVELGLVERTADPADGRAHLVSTTSTARHRLTEVNASRRVWLDERLAGFDDDELSEFVRLLGRYNASLEV